MYARSTTVEAQPSSIDAGIAHIRDVVMPALQEIDGCVGLSLLVDRQSGRCIATSAWRTEEAMRASAERVQPIRDRAAQMFGGSATVDEWEIAFLHRDHPSPEGACVRTTWLKIRPDQFAHAIEFYKTSVLPAIQELEGFCSASLMVDRASGRAVSSSTFDSLEAMERNGDRARSLRTGLLRDLGADQLDVGEFELALAHLRVPELV
jgi:heme-degrading monooxygenase HmoA